MRIIGNFITDLKSVPAKAAEAEKLGYDSGYCAEINNDPFLPALLAAEHTDKIELMTSIAVAFARNPMTLANTAHDLNEYSGGRFVLGVGSQIKPHITRRMSMPWSRPAARMREFILAMRAIWSCWNDDAPLKFEGEFYQHTLMTPMFVPSQRDHGAPQVKLAAVGPMMTEVAGEVADGMIAHGFTTAEYLRQVTMPALDRGLKRAGRDRASFDVCCPIISVTGCNEEEFMRSKQAVVMQLAFYASTPAYKPVLALHGWDDIQEEAHRLSKQGKWLEMGALINDDILNHFAIVCENPAELPMQLQARYAGLVDSWECTAELSDQAAQSELIRAVRAI